MDVSMNSLFTYFTRFRARLLANNIVRIDTFHSNTVCLMQQGCRCLEDVAGNFGTNVSRRTSLGGKSLEQVARTSSWQHSDRICDIKIDLKGAEPTRPDPSCSRDLIGPRTSKVLLPGYPS